MLSAGRRFFIRLTGCPLRCVYCDTEYAFYGGEWRTVGELLETARGSGVPHVCVTGGEPLAQKSCLELLSALCDAGFDVSLETSGAMDVWRCRSAREPRGGHQDAGFRRVGPQPHGQSR